MLKINQEMQVRKRDGRTLSFDRELIARAIRKAFRADLGLDQLDQIDADKLSDIERITESVVRSVMEKADTDAGVDVEEIQDNVEQELMRAEYFSVARRYIIYRAERNRMRKLRAEETMETTGSEAFPEVMVNRDGQFENLDFARLRSQVNLACRGVEESCRPQELFDEVERQFYSGITPKEISRAMVLAARSRIENDPSYDTVASRLMLNIIYRESLDKSSAVDNLEELYEQQFPKFIGIGIEAGRIAPELKDFDLPLLAQSIRPERDQLFHYHGLQTIYDRYLLHIDGRRIEAPQYFWMRVAMGLAIGEGEQKNQRAVEFYNVLSMLRFTSATPTLFNSGTCHPQLSSCYLSTVSDDLDHIFKVISDNAKLSKWAGGLGNDWTNIRATNSHIRGTNGQSQGVIPFLKVVSDTAVAVNQGGKRKGAVCSYLETWHLDIEEFLDLRKNTGDDRRRTHDMHTANWIPDLFMKRVANEQEWTLFSPDDAPDLHDLVGEAFEQRYEFYERQADAGKIKLTKRLPAVELWRKMLTRVFETGHPWITFKDPSNIRSPQDHAGCCTQQQSVYRDPAQHVS